MERVIWPQQLAQVGELLVPSQNGSTWYPLHSFSFVLFFHLRILSQKGIKYEQVYLHFSIPLSLYCTGYVHNEFGKNCCSQVCDFYGGILVSSLDTDTMYIVVLPPTPEPGKLKLTSSRQSHVRSWLIPECAVQLVWLHGQVITNTQHCSNYHLLLINSHTMSQASLFPFTQRSLNKLNELKIIHDN